MTPRQALRWSLLLHGVIALLLANLSRQSARAQVEAEQRASVQAYQPEYYQHASAAYADRLQRMRELLEQLTPPETAQTAAPPASPAADDPLPAGDSPPENPVQQLWQQSRANYQAIRERYVQQRAAELARLTETDPQQARQRLPAGAEDALAGRPTGPTSLADAAREIAAMHGHAQTLVQQAVRQQLEGASGSVPSDALLAEAHQLVPTLAGIGRPGEAFDLAAQMLSRSSQGNSELDTDEDRSRTKHYQNHELRSLFDLTQRDVVFTRRLGRSAVSSARWVAPDAWYIIGPFPNPGRSAIDTPYPPELEINRDAAYEGRDGRPLVWDYVRPSTLSVKPPHMADYGVYYAFTEIHCAEPLECWLAIGSDDYSKLWINDFLVWAGSKNEKEWRPTEGFRRVHLQAGVNRFLLRLENGINACEFSVLFLME